MKSSERLSEIIYRHLARPYLKAFTHDSPEQTLKRSLSVLDGEILISLKNYLKRCQTPSGGFADKAGKHDLYYTVFGHFLADAFELTDMHPLLNQYLEGEVRKNIPKGIHLYCAAIMYAKSGSDADLKRQLHERIRQTLYAGFDKQPAYNVFLSLLACYYLEDYRSMFLLRKQLKSYPFKNSMPSPVLAALLVINRSFQKSVDGLIADLFTFYDANGGFKATRGTPVPDLLSTAVSLYALRFAGADLRKIKPACFEFINALFSDGGFSGTLLDPDPDVEYTFYGLLALGALTE